MDALSKADKMAEGAVDLKSTLSNKELEIKRLNEELQRAKKEKNVRVYIILLAQFSLCEWLFMSLIDKSQYFYYVLNCTFPFLWLLSAASVLL